MNWQKLATAAALGAVSTLAVACGGPVDGPGKNTDKNTTPDGVKKEKPNFSKKGDKWNWLNDPERFKTDLKYAFSKLKSEKEGYTENEVWPATYWPLYKGSILQRWQGDDIMSPVEKYDRVYNDWVPEMGFSEFMKLQPYDQQTCEWDDKYYEHLGPAADDIAHDSNWKAHNGKDDDGDGVKDAEECGYGDNKDYDGVETWFGLCHAWAPAAVLEEEPKKPVTLEGANGNEVKFSVSDIKALIIEKYDQSESYMVGGRCNSSEVERDDTGRISSDKCRDVNAGSFHVLMTNFLGLQGRPIIEDRVYDYEVWNQPIVGYKITKQKKLSLEEVKQKLNTAEERDEDSTPETSEEKKQALKAANTLSEDELVEDAGLRSDKATAIIQYRQDNGNFSEYSALESEVGARTLSRLLDYAYNQDWLSDDSSQIYSYNEDAEEFVEVEMDVDYVTESSPSTEPLADRLEEYTRSDHYHYILELDGSGNIIGGEWVGRSIEQHPDFLWLPTAPGGGTDNIDLAKVRELLAKSNPSDDGSDDDSDSSTDEVQTYENNNSVSIPDNDYQGTTSTIEVSDASGKVKSVTLSVDIEHAYRGDIAIVLRKDGTRTIVYKGWKVDNPWKDDVKISSEQVDGFGGLSVSGTWKLQVVDVTSPDAGTLKSWSIKPQLQD